MVLANEKKRNASLLIILSIFVLFLSGCEGRQEVQDSYEMKVSEAESMIEELEPGLNIRPALVVDEKPWFGHQAVRMRNGDPIPSAFTGSNSIVITFEKPLTLQELGRQIQISTGLRMVTTSRELGTTEEAETFLPVDGVEVAGGRVLWQGPLDRLLNQVSDRFDVEWSYVNNVIKMTSSVTRTFMLHALAGEITTSGNVETGSTSEAGNLPSQSVDTSVTLSIWEEIQSAVENILGSNGEATFSAATGTITVTGNPSAVRDVEEYLRYQNRMRLRRVAVSLRVLNVQKSDVNNFGLDLEGVFERAFDNQPLYYSSTAAGGLTAGIVRELPSTLLRQELNIKEDGQELDDGIQDSAQAAINALASTNKVSIVHTGTVITLSDQPAPLQIARQRTYIARVSAAATSDSSSTSLEPGTVEEGLTMNVLPRVVEKDRVLLRVGIGITQVRDIVDFTAGDLTVQLPDLDTTGFLQNIVLSSGETLVLSGFERNNLNRDQVGTGRAENLLLGGRDNVEKSRSLTVLLLTADILPEDPFGVLR